MRESYFFILYRSFDYIIILFRMYVFGQTLYSNIKMSVVYSCLEGVVIRVITKMSGFRNILPVFSIVREDIWSSLIASFLFFRSFSTSVRSISLHATGRGFYYTCFLFFLARFLKKKNTKSFIHSRTLQSVGSVCT